MDKKIIPLSDCKALNDSEFGSFSGYGSIYGNYDRVGEAVAPGAFSNLDQFLTDGFVAIGHDWNDLPVATIAEVKSDNVGLYIRADFHSTDDAQEARAVVNERIARGKFVGLSIGYQVNQSEITDQGRLLTDLTLYEVSIVTVPANELAGVTAAKNKAPDAMSLDEQTQVVLATTRDYTDRLKALHELRAKDNRQLSANRRAELLELKALIDQVVNLTTPKANSDAVKNAYARLLATSAQIPNEVANNEH